jgi:TatD DNase family protein
LIPKDPLLIDTHCHLDFDSFDRDRDAVIARATESGVERIIVPALDLKNCQKVLDLADRYNLVFAAVGVHPNSSGSWRDEWIDILRELAQHDKVVAIGEIGLDYYRDRSPHHVQRRALSAQLELASELNLPVIIHNRQSDADLIAVLGDSPLMDRERPGVLHSFSASWETAEAALSLGYYLGFTGPVTFKKADELRSIVSRLPLDQLLVETDAPFLAPQQYRGKRNEPAYVTLIADRIAEIHNISLEKLALLTTRNAVQLFGNQLV